MTLDERILDFLDGSLPNDDEAELLHTLSVSPEKRGVMRGFMEQRSLLVRDSKALQVPFEAEQRLWERLDAVMPAASSAAEPALIPIPVETAGTMAAHSFRGLSMMASALTLVAGMGIGYFTGVRNAPVETKVVKVVTPAVAQAANNAATSAPVYERIIRRTIIAPTVVASTGIAPTAMSGMPLISPSAPTDGMNASNGMDASPAIASVAPESAPAIILNNHIGGSGGGVIPVFHHSDEILSAQHSLLDRFELRVDESFGRQFPNNAETSVSWPLITNSSISAFFQILPHSNLIWVGGGYGSASVTMKELSVQQGDPQSQYIPLSQDVLQADTVHKQTTYFAAMGELRLPAFAATDLTLGGGYGWASLGRMMFGELGFHYNISEQVGTQFGLRVMRFAYDLAAQKQAAIQSAPGGLAISNAVASVGPSFNTELNAGLFFDF